MSDPSNDPVEAARRSYAEDLRFTAHIRSMAVGAAFAAVPATFPTYTFSSF